MAPGVTSTIPTLRQAREPWTVFHRRRQPTATLMALVEVSHLVKHFTRHKGLFRAGTIVKAVDDVSFNRRGRRSVSSANPAAEDDDGPLHPPAGRRDIG
jgi:ABC-type glutathione transport system ATPase component